MLSLWPPFLLLSLSLLLLPYLLLLLLLLLVAAFLFSFVCVSYCVCATCAAGAIVAATFLLILVPFLLLLIWSLLLSLRMLLCCCYERCSSAAVAAAAVAAFAGAAVGLGKTLISVVFRVAVVVTHSLSKGNWRSCAALMGCGKMILSLSLLTVCCSSKDSASGCSGDVKASHAVPRPTNAKALNPSTNVLPTNSGWKAELLHPPNQPRHTPTCQSTHRSSRLQLRAPSAMLSSAMGALGAVLCVAAVVAATRLSNPPRRLPMQWASVFGCGAPTPSSWPLSPSLLSSSSCFVLQPALFVERLPPGSRSRDSIARRGDTIGGFVYCARPSRVENYLGQLPVSRRVVSDGRLSSRCASDG